jgi:hypothetical protein
VTAHTTTHTSQTAEIGADRKHFLSAAIFAGITPQFWSLETPAAAAQLPHVFTFRLHLSSGANARNCQLVEFVGSLAIRERKRVLGDYAIRCEKKSTGCGKPEKGAGRN